MVKNTTTKSTTMQYLENAEFGVIVAFRTEIKGSLRTLSGKLAGRTTTDDGVRLANIETKNGSMFTVAYEDIIWVKTGERWPKWIFEELKKK